jgi:hypothetical protein
LKKLILFIFVLLLFLCISSFGIAFDNHRRGFIIGGIGGVAVNNWHEQDDAAPDPAHRSGTNFALHTDFRVGGGFKGDKLMLYYWNIVNWLKIVEDDPDAGDLSINGITGVGTSYYFKTTSPSLYINAGIGTSVWYRGVSALFPDRHFGFGAMGGIGYEFARHWNVEGGVMWGRASTFDGKPNFFAGTLSIIGIAY